jgi:hypothetical protein
MAQTNRFSALRQLRNSRQEETTLPEQTPTKASPSEHNAPQADPLPPENTTSSSSPSSPKTDKEQPQSAPEPQKKRGPGRPRGRRSNPDYTQISAYIPLELLLEVQDELAEERREKKQRTPRPVSDLMEELLSDWLKTRKGENSKI